MSKATAVLFGIEDEFDVLSVDRLNPGQVKIIVEMRSAVAPCPACGVFTSRVKDRPLRRIKDLPASGQQSQLWWRKRRLVCAEALCPRRSFTQESVAIRARARVTERLRTRVAGAIAAGNRAVSEVAAEYGVSWPTAHKALVAAAARWLPELIPTARLGIDETRFRSVRCHTSTPPGPTSSPSPPSPSSCGGKCGATTPYRLTGHDGSDSPSLPEVLRAAGLEVETGR